MEIDHLTRECMLMMGEETSDAGDEDDDCECMALHEKGFRGPCYYCMRKDHMLRNCPRKSAGLPRIRDPARQGRQTYPSTGGKPKWIPSGKMIASQGGNPRTGRGQYVSGRRVNQVDEEPEDEEEGTEEDAEVVGEEKAEVTYLGVITL